MHLDTPLPVLTTVPTATTPNVGKGKRQVGPRVDDEVIKEVRILAIRQERRLNELIDEALIEADRGD